jgi:hypothetical protein
LLTLAVSRYFGERFAIGYEKPSHNRVVCLVAAEAIDTKPVYG